LATVQIKAEEAAVVAAFDVGVCSYMTLKARP